VAGPTPPSRYPKPSRTNTLTPAGAPSGTPPRTGHCSTSLRTAQLVGVVRRKLNGACPLCSGTEATVLIRPGWTVQGPFILSYARARASTDTPSSLRFGAGSPVLRSPTRVSHCENPQLPGGDQVGDAVGEADYWHLAHLECAWHTGNQRSSVRPGGRRSGRQPRGTPNPRPERRASYHPAAASSSCDASGSKATGRLTRPSASGGHGHARRSTTRPATRPPRPFVRAVRVPPPTPAHCSVVTLGRSLEADQELSNQVGPLRLGQRERLAKQRLRVIRHEVSVPPARDRPAAESTAETTPPLVSGRRHGHAMALCAHRRWGRSAHRHGSRAVGGERVPASALRRETLTLRVR
jgi:hypothetical protein